MALGPLSRVKSLGRFATTKLAGEGPQVVAGDNLGAATSKTEPPRCQKPDQHWRGEIGIRRQPGWPVAPANPWLNPLAERTSRRTPQSAGSAELPTGGCADRRQVVASRQ